MLFRLFPDFFIVYLVILSSITIIFFLVIYFRNRKRSLPDIINQPATVVAKRTMYNNRPFLMTNYITFSLENGERIEMFVSSSIYGVLLAGDHGMLFYRNFLVRPRFQNFIRT